MDSNVNVLMSCILWILQYSGACTKGCHVTRIEETSRVTCSGYRLKTVPQHLPVNTTALNLRNNDINTLPGKSFSNLHALKALTLSMNKLSIISTNAFYGLRNLEYLDLSENNLDVYSFDTTTFHILEKLKYLNIQRNRFHLTKLYPQYAVSHMSQLETLIIDVFEGFRFGSGFLNLTKLHKIEFNNVSEERVSFQNSSFLGLKNSNISCLDISVRMKKIEIDCLSPFSRLSSLSLSSKRTIPINVLLRALNGLRGRIMESITLHTNDVRFNGMIHLTDSDFSYLGTICIKKLNLTRNSIGTISVASIVSWTKRPCLEMLDLSRNIIHSPVILVLINLFPSITYVDISYMGERQMRKRDIPFKRQTVFFIPRKLRYLNVSHCPIDGALMNFSISTKNNLHVLDLGNPTRTPRCSYGFFTGLIHLTELDISGFECSTPYLETLTEMHNLTRFGASHCSLGDSFTANTTLFKGLYNLTSVDISSNNIKTLNIQLFEDQKDSLHTLVLAQNNMERLPTGLLQSLSVLERLDMRKNLITTLTISEYVALDEMQRRTERFRINLSENPLVCSCHNVDFISWIETTRAIYNKEELVCSVPGGKQMKIEEFLEMFDQFQENCVSQFWLIVSVTLCVLLIVLGIASRESWRRSVWLRVRCREPSAYNKYPYDIFISYSDEDSCWVANTFAQWLNEKGIQYCLDEKSFNPGCDIADNIMDAIDSSRRTVFVVSSTYLEHEWTMFTMKLASVYSFREGRENMNIVILLNDIKRSEFPKLMRKNWNTIRPLHWPRKNTTDPEKDIAAEQVFWKRLLKRIQRENNIVVSSDVSKYTA
ncbi:toll-like receptor 4 [Pecten maximus]|uniref:toll-like receptor 4 n=1 Tax=Pecten maximus TaxID=6579 RepID=UPI001458AFDF|nr:toll-like receptor 4 [Pecten maximus]